MSIDGRAFLKDLHQLCFVDVPAESRRAMQDAVREAERDVKNTSAFKDVTGNLRNKTVGVVLDSTRGELRSSPHYALYIENGTRPHVIPGNPRLNFYWQKVGLDVSFNSVNHPGNTARHYMEHAGKWGELVLEHQLGAFITGSISRFNSK